MTIMTTDPPEPQNQDMAVAPLVSSAPSSKLRLSTTDSTLTSNDTTERIKRSNSSIEGKYKCTITSDRLSRLRKIVEGAIKEHKVFTIKGGWPILRRELLKRNWVEKCEGPSKSKPPQATTAPNTDELVGNLPVKQDWESPSAYIEKCEKTIMSRMLQNFDVDFYWNMRKDQSDLMHRSSTYKLMNRFGKSLFTSKEGLSLLLQQAYWYHEPGVSHINYPRCYVLGFPDHFSNFVDDFRMSACIGLLKCFVCKYDTEESDVIQSPEGRVPYSALQFAMKRCIEYVETQKHLDIDKTYDRVWDHEWDQFLSHYFMIMHESQQFLETKDHKNLVSLYTKVKNVLIDVAKCWPEFAIDGMRNIWILKPGNKCRGRGIQLIKNIADVERVVNLKMKYVVQKYIEKPLLIYNTKFDIRQWFIVAGAQPLTIWMYRECYLRFSSQIFTLDNFHESLHLTNHAVQCKYTNDVAQRDKNLPDDNMWDCHTFQTYLKQIGCREKWNEVVFPGMRQGIICAMLASQDVMDRRQNTYELYGADFMVSEDFRPWLLEINSSPDLSHSTSVTKRMCPQCLEDLIKVVVDRKRDPNADTGLFDLVYKQNLPRVPPYLGMNLSIRGRKIFKNKAKIKQQARDMIDMENAPPTPYLYKRDPKILDVRRCATALPKIISTPANTLYKGPIIEDLIDDLTKSYKTQQQEGTQQSGSGLTRKQEILRKKSESANPKRERVSRRNRFSLRSKFNQNHFVLPDRKRNVRENTSVKSSEVAECNNNHKFGVFRQWASRFRDSSSSATSYKFGQGDNSKGGHDWEKETVSILKGKHIVGNNNNNSTRNHGPFGNKVCSGNVLFDLGGDGDVDSLPHETADA